MLFRSQKLNSGNVLNCLGHVQLCAKCKILFHLHTLLTPLSYPQSLKRATALIQSSLACCLQSQPCPLGISPEFSFCKQLGKDVRNIVSSQNVSNCNFSVLNHFTNKVVAHINVFCVHVKFVILSECNCSLIITI